MTIFLPVYMQVGLKFDAARAGLALLPLTCAMPIGGMIAGRDVPCPGIAPKFVYAGGFGTIHSRQAGGMRPCAGPRAAPVVT